MPPVAAATGDMFQLRIVGRQEGQETNNVLHLVAASPSDDVETHLIAVMAQCFITNIIPSLTSAWSFREIRWKKVGPTLGPELIYPITSGGVGGASGPNMPTTNAVCCSIHTLEGGRSKHGRLYLAGIPDDATANSILNEAGEFFTAVVAFLACIATNFIVGDPPPSTNAFQLGVYSRKLGSPSFPYTSAGFTPAASFSINDVLATMRSRKVGRGS